jgi:hypothetical protein
MQTTNTRISNLVIFLLIFFGFAGAPGLPYASASQPIHFDLAKINGDGSSVCLSKGRIQDPDYNQSKVVDQIIAAGPEAIPVLIGMITDTKRTKEPIFCFWPYTAIGDIAFTTLTDLFTNPSWDASTIPGAGWDEMLGKGDSSGSERLHNFIQKYGRAALQAKWQKIWDAYKSRIYWDSTERCFRLKK